MGAVDPPGKNGSGLVQASEEVKAFAVTGPWTPPVHPQKEQSDTVSINTYKLGTQIMWETYE